MNYVIRVAFLCETESTVGIGLVKWMMYESSKVEQVH